MAWRVLDNAGEVWHVQAVAEMRPQEKVWQLVLSFRTKDAEPRQSFWADYPLESSSKTSLFHAADKITDDTLRQVIEQHLS
jgi:hypothetical protein